jgi:hypothetical protein
MTRAPARFAAPTNSAADSPLSPPARGRAAARYARVGTPGADTNGLSAAAALERLTKLPEPAVEIPENLSKGFDLADLFKLGAEYF